MRYAVRALGWVTKILWILIIAFSATAVYSAMGLRMSFGEPRAYLSNGFMVLSIPLFINNSGFYNLSDLSMTVNVTDSNGSLLSASSTSVDSIPGNRSVDTTHNISINLNDTAKLQTYLFNDTIFNIDMSLKVKFAGAIPFQASTNMTIPWGAPLYNFSIGQFSYAYLNFTHQEIMIPISFENHSPYFGIDGSMNVEIYNNNDELLGSSASDLNVSSYSSYNGQVEMIVDVSKITRSGEVYFYFETSAFSFGPLVMPYG